jgi:hypothetical protein
MLAVGPRLVLNAEAMPISNRSTVCGTGRITCGAAAHVAKDGFEQGSVARRTPRPEPRRDGIGVPLAQTAYGIEDG